MDLVINFVKKIDIQVSKTQRERARYRDGGCVITRDVPLCNHRTQRLDWKDIERAHIIGRGCFNWVSHSLCTEN
jgi:hypothetical protein